MKTIFKKRILKAAALFTALLLPLQTAAANYGDNVLTNPFSEERPMGDANLDGCFDIRDLIRLKKYASGMAVTVDLGIFDEAAEAKRPIDWEACSYNYVYVKTSLTDDGECVYATTKDGKAQTVGEDKYLYNLESNTGNQLYAGILFVSDTINEPINISAGDGITFYVKAECANTILPIMVVNDPKVSYEPDMALKIGSEYSYRTVDGDWITAKASVTGQKNDGEKNYFGAISFDEPFEGYIRLPFSSLSNSNSNVRVLDAENNILRMLCKVKNLGGEYGGITFGHIRIYSENGVGGAGTAETLAFLRKALLNG